MKTINFLLLFHLIFVIQSVFATEYKRSDWKHWIQQGQCLNTRAMILKERSLVPVTFNQRKDGKQCSVNTGRWQDFYYNEILEKAEDIDIDHVVPLHYAHLAGGALWPAELKELFANDPQNLVVTNKRYNRQKGAKGPLEWMPIDRRYACRYMNRWMEIKNKYELSISAKEKEHHLMLDCKNVSEVPHYNGAT